MFILLGSIWRADLTTMRLPGVPSPHLGLAEAVWWRG